MSRGIPTSGAAFPSSEAAVPADAATLPTSSAAIPEPAEGGGGAAADDFVSKCKESSDLFGLWTCRDVGANDGVETGDLVMKDASDNGQPSLECVLASTGNWLIKEDGPAPGTLASLSKYIRVDYQGATNYAAAASAFSSAPVSAGEEFSAFAFYYTPQVSTSVGSEGVAFAGSIGSVANSDRAKCLLLWYHYANWPFTKYGRFGYLADDGAKVYKAYGTTGIASNWNFWAVRGHNTSGGTIQDITVYNQRLGVDWGTNQVTFTFNWNAYGTYSILKDGLRISGDGTGTPSGDYRWGPIGIFSGDIGVGASGVSLRTIFESIS